MKRIVSVLLSMALLQVCFSQTYMWGTTRSGGANNYGSISKMKLDGTGFTRAYSFTSNNGRNPSGGLQKAANNKFYGIVLNSPNYSGAIYSFRSCKSLFVQINGSL